MTIELLTVAELAELLKCDEQAAARALNDGRLPGLKLGRGWMVPKDALGIRLRDLALEESEQRRLVRMSHTLEEARLPGHAVATAPSVRGRKAARRPPPLPSLQSPCGD